MRITTQMVNEAAMKSGLPINQSTLLDYMNNESNADTLLEALEAKSESAYNKVDAANLNTYKKLEKAADELDAQAQRFMAEGSESFFEKAKASGDTSELYKEAKELLEKYNTLFSAMKGSSDSMNAFYRQSMQELVSSGKETLAAVGISVESDGSLTIDADKFKSASMETLETVLGRNDSFSTSLSFIAAKVGNYANANLKSATSSYLSNGTAASGYYGSKFDFLG